MVELILKIWLVGSINVFLFMAITLIMGYQAHRYGGEEWTMDKGDIIPFIGLTILGPITPFVFMWVIYKRNTDYNTKSMPAGEPDD